MNMGKDGNRVIGKELAIRLKPHIDELDPSFSLLRLAEALNEQGVQLTKAERTALTALGSAMVRHDVMVVADLKMLDPNSFIRWRRMGKGNIEFLKKILSSDETTS